LHHLQRGADMRRQIGLVDDQEIRPRDAGAALGGNLVAGGDVDHVDGQIGKLRRKGGGEVVAAGLDQHQVEVGKFSAHVGNSSKVDRGVLADRGVRAAAGL